ncbi:hypothetical protein N7520_009670 [Penicillium odoratum]|uniref:uncharacterized protein n=1 Tax=Penicillium odoratum TaxID=1167516 RepID=UPI002548D3FE|nr:uncharacterized protein N7520_009670 [Penicillium odoratum]KAJ5752753.1 hypothetical protein N7520_009670 [Penicillium odoratum]
MDLLLALDTIRNASDHSLHSHATQTILTLRRVGQRLQHNLFAETPSFQASPSELTSVPSPPQSPRPLQSAVSHQKTLGDPNVTSPQFSRSSQIAGSPDYQTTAIRHPPGGPSPKSRQPSLLEFPTQSPDTCPLLPGRDSSLSIVSPALLNAPTPPDHVPDLLKRVKQSAEWAWEVCQKGTSHILPRKRNCDEDPRLEHIRRVEGDRFLGNEDKLLRILALRSIALEFTNKQIDDKVSPTKLEEICEHSLLRKPAQKIFKYDSKDFSSKALSAGLKHLVLEKIIADRLGRCDLPNMCNAISAIVGLHIDQFRRLRYNEMTNFADKLLSEDMHVTILQSKVHLLDLVRDLSPYFIELQNFYDEFRIDVEPTELPAIESMS